MEGSAPYPTPPPFRNSFSWLNYLIYDPQQQLQQNACIYGNAGGSHGGEEEEDDEGQINFHFANQIYCTLCGAYSITATEMGRWGAVERERRGQHTHLYRYTLRHYWPLIGWSLVTRSDSFQPTHRESKERRGLSTRSPAATPATIDRHAPIAS